MNLLTIAVKNGSRRKVKTLLLLLVFSVGVTAVVGLGQVSVVVGENLEKKLTSFGANILVQPVSDELTVGYGGFSLGHMVLDVKYLSESEVDSNIDSIALRQNVSVVAPKLITASRVGDTPVGVVGVRWKDELVLKGYWHVSGAFPSAENEVIAGSNAASKLGLTLGEPFMLGDTRVVLSGILASTGSDDDNVILGDLGMVQAMLGRPGAVSFVEVAALCAGCPIEDIVAQLAQALPGTSVTAMQNVVKQRMYSVHFVRNLALTVSVVILLAACGMVGMTMLASVNERVREIGLMRALGFSRSAVFGLFCSEAVFIGVVAGVLGYVGGHFLSLEVLRSLDMAGEGEAFRIGGIFACAAVFGLVAGIAAFGPSWKAAATEPASALSSL